MFICECSMYASWCVCCRGCTADCSWCMLLSHFIPFCSCSNVSEAVIFLFLGISLYESRSIDFALIGLSILFCLVFRPLGECLVSVVRCTVGMNRVLSRNEFFGGEDGKGEVRPR